MSTRLSVADYERAAQALGCRREVVQAVAAVESLDRGTLSSGRVVILFEAHVFSRLTAHRFDTTHPAISSTTWNRNLYRGGEVEYARLEEALQLDPEAALKSASWGLFQIMGFNAEKAGFANVTHMAFAMQEKEQRHLDAFVRFIRGEGLADALVRSDFEAFAKGYNGPRYAENRYPQRMRAALARLMRG
ncbi:MAG: N-acetylmuramidase family protein [Xanthomonadales bacterium]|nr:N-acetylmuramidase family protein [Xanthomonadales bacterium]